MNLKYILKNSFGEIVYCVIKDNAHLQEEFEKVLSIQKGYGFSVDCSEDKINLVDYFAGETRATYYILKKEKTIEELQYFLKRV